MAAHVTDSTSMITLDVAAAGVRDRATNGSDAVTGQAITNKYNDTTPPALSSAAVNASGTEVTLTFSEALDSTNAAAKERFTLRVAGNGVTIGAASTAGQTVTLGNLGAVIEHGRTVVVIYNDLTTGDDTTGVVQDGSGNDAAAFTTGQSSVPGVTNNSVKPDPTVTGIEFTSRPAANQNGTFKLGDTITATVTFDLAVAVTGTPRLELDVGGTARQATCALDAADAKKLVCSYTVAATDMDANGVAIASDRLARHGGSTIKRNVTGGGNAALDHDAVSADSSRKVDGVRPTVVTAGDDAPRTSRDGTKAILTFSEDIGSVVVGSITVRVGGSNVTPTGSSINGATVELTLPGANPIPDSATTVRIDWTAGAFVDLAGNGSPVQSTALSVTNNYRAATAPGAPVLRYAHSKPGGVQPSWEHPDDDGGAALTGYDYRHSADGGTTWSAWTAFADHDGRLSRNSGEIGSLDPDTEYTFEVRARNRVGPGAASNRLTQTPSVAVKIAWSNATVNEGDTVTLTVTLGKVRTSAVTVWLKAVPGDVLGTKGRLTEDDYSPVVPGHLTIPAGDLSASVDFEITDDAEGEPVEAVVIHLYTPNGYMAWWPYARLVVRESDGGGELRLPYMSVNDASMRESGRYEPTWMRFVVWMRPAADETVEVSYATEDGSAKAGEDYEALSGTLTFEPGETVHLVWVEVLDDEVEDDGETFRLRLSDMKGAPGGYLADEVATGTIRNTEEVVTAQPLERLVLVDAATRTDVATLSDGVSVALADPVGGSYTVRADTVEGAILGNVRLELSGAKTARRTMGVAPWVLYGKDWSCENGPCPYGEGLPAGSYTVTATAFEGGAASTDVLQSLSASFTVTAAVAPALGVETPGPFAVAEGATAVATLAASDTGNAQTWSIPAGDAGGADAGAFTLSENGALAFRAAKDFEAPDDADGDGTYEVTVRVSEGADSVDAALRVTVTDVNEAPVAAVAAPALVSQGARVTLDGSASADPDADDTLTLAWTQDDTGAPAVTLSDAAAAKPTFTAPTGLSADTVLTFTLRASDAAGLIGEASVSVTVSGVPEVSIAAASTYVKEGTDAVFALARAGDVSQALTVAVSVAEEGAVLGADVPASITFAAGSGEAELRVPTVDDGTHEPDATVTGGARYRRRLAADRGRWVGLGDGARRRRGAGRGHRDGHHAVVGRHAGAAVLRRQCRGGERGAVLERGRHGGCDGEVAVVRRRGACAEPVVHRRRGGP